jgi:hypothetical protein
MNEEEQVIRHFYSCMQQQDWKGMLTCYREDIFFYDPIFENLEGGQVRAMWEMLLSNAKSFEFNFSHIEAEDGYGSCQWIAAYTFSGTGRRVVNRGKAFFKFSGGKIAEHQDDYSIWKWSGQALGVPGILFGWSSLVKDKVRQKARTSLERFRASH